jgi:hypothetical protein
MRPRLWLAADFTWYSGGQVTTEHVVSSSPQSNSRGGLTLSVPLPARQSLKFAYSSGLVSRTGTDFNTFAISWQLAWFDKRFRAK